MFALLAKGHSPAQIIGTLLRIYPGHPERNISHVSIYTATSMPRGELRKELISLLSQSRKTRRPRVRGDDRRGQIPDMVSIHLRPPEFDERRVPDHWEGDKLKGAGNTSSIGAMIERTTLFVVLPKLGDGTAKSALYSFSRLLNRIDAQNRISTTYDRGKEMSDHVALTD